MQTHELGMKGLHVQRKIVVVSAGLGSPSSSRMLADQLSAAVVAQLDQLDCATELSVVELRDVAVDIANNMVTGYAPPALAAVIDQVTHADALIIVTPVFSASYSGLFKSFFDVLEPKALEGMPVILGATAGTARHSLVLDFALRPLFAYFRANTMPTAVFAGPDDWGTTGQGHGLAGRIAAAAGELVSFLSPTTPPQCGLGTVDSVQAKRELREAEKLESLPFEQLLANISGSH